MIANKRSTNIKTDYEGMSYIILKNIFKLQDHTVTLSEDNISMAASSITQLLVFNAVKRG